MPIYLNDIHYWLSFWIPPVGFLLNIILLWLIAKKTPKELKTHSRILLQTCSINFCMMAISIFARTARIVLTDGTIVVFFEGYFLGKNTFSAYGLYIIYIMGASILIFNLCGLSAQFIYRYLFLIRDMKISFVKYLLMLLPSFLALILITIITYQSSIKSVGMQEISNKPELLNIINWNSDPIYITFIREDNTLSKASLYFAAFVQAVAYGAIIFTAVKMMLFMRLHNSLPNIRDINRQVIRNLIILASYPLFVTMISLFFTIFSPVLNLATFGDGQITVNFITNFLSAWLPIFNPLSSILTIRAYRNALLEKCVWFRSGTIVHPIPVQSPPAILVQTAATRNSSRQRNDFL